MSFEPTFVLHDNGLIAMNKPAGMLSTGDRVDDPDCLQGWLMAKLDSPRIWAVHQLDKHTSGVNLFVEDSPLVGEWAAHLKRGKKFYLAVVRGPAPVISVTVEAPIGKKGGRLRVTPGGKPARTQLETLSHNGEDDALLRVQLLTGRTHQARIHLAHLGLSLYGERRYGPKDAVFARQALHAWRIEAGGMRIEAPLPDDLRALCHRLGLELPGSDD